MKRLLRWLMVRAGGQYNRVRVDERARNAAVAKANAQTHAALVDARRVVGRLESMAASYHRTDQRL